MILEGVLENLIASAIGAIFLAIAGKLLNDYYYIGIDLSDKEKKNSKNEKDSKKDSSWIKIYRKLPWRHAYRYAKKTAGLLKDGKADELFEPTIIVGIGRGGAIYGSICSYYLKETPLLALERKYLYDDNDNRIGVDWYYPIDIPKELLERVLLVAGEYHSGKTMLEFKKRLTEIGAKEIRSCVLYYQTPLEKQVGKPDYYGIINKRDCLMPWQEKQFLRTWKDSDDARVREYTLKKIEMEALKDGFFLMRHATTAANVKDCFIGSGSPDESISAEGMLEARNVGQFLKEIIGKVDLIYCSPLKRCIQTATEVQKVAGGEIIQDDRLIEADFGDWEGVSRKSLPKKEYNQYVKNQEYKIPGSKDSYSANKERIKSFLDEIISSYSAHGKRVLVVTHKVVGRIMVQIIEHKENQHFRSIPMENASLRRIVIKDNEASIPYYIKVLDEDIVIS